MADSFDFRSDAMWDDLVSGIAPDLEGDAGAASALRFTHSLSQTPIPGSARERARQRVFDSMPSSQENDMTALTLPASVPATNGHSPGLRVPRPRPAEPAHISRRYFWFSLAAVLALLLAGLSGWFAYDRLGNTNSVPAVIPAVQEATPTPTESGWPQFRGGAARTGYTSDPGPGGNLDLRWTFTADDVLGNLVSDAGSVYIYGKQGDLYALDAGTGAQRWAVDLSPNGYSDENRWPTPAVADGIVYVGSYDGNMLALDAKDGSVIWQRALSTKPIVASPLVVDGLLYQISPDGAIVQLDRATGDTVWEWTGDTTLSNWAPAAGDGLIFVPDEGGDLIAVDTATGTTKWTADLNDAHRNPAYADGVVYIGGDSLSYYALDATDGSVIWKTEPGVGDQTLNPVVTPDALIVSYQNGPMEALDRATGSVLWSVDGPGSSLSPHAGALAVYCVSADQSALVAYDLKTGAELGRIDADGLGSVAAISGDTIVFGNFDEGGAVRAIGPHDREPVAVTAGPATVIPAVTAAPQATPANGISSSTFDASQVTYLSEIATAGTTTLVGPMPVVGPDGTLYLVDADLSTIFVFSSHGEFLEQWGEPGTGPGQFDTPGDIGFDADGNIYVFDSLNSRVQQFAPDRTFLMEWGSEGTGNGEFGEFYGTVDPIDELVYTVDYQGNRVQVFDLDGNFLDKWGSVGKGAGQFVHPATVVVGPDGLIYVGDTANGSGSRVQIFDKYGTLKGTLLGSDGKPTTFSEVWGIAFDSAGNIFVADYWDHSIRVFDAEWQQIGRIADVEGAGPFTHPVRLAIDADNNLYVGDYDAARIVKLALPPLPE